MSGFQIQKPTLSKHCSCVTTVSQMCSRSTSVSFVYLERVSTMDEGNGTGGECGRLHNAIKRKTAKARTCSLDHARGFLFVCLFARRAFEVHVQPDVGGGLGQVVVLCLAHPAVLELLLEPGLIAEKCGNIFRVGIFLDFVWRSGTTRTPHVGSPHVRPMGRTRGEPNEIELTPIGVKLNGSRRVHCAASAPSTRPAAHGRRSA